MAEPQKYVKLTYFLEHVPVEFEKVKTEHAPLTLFLVFFIITCWTRLQQLVMELDRILCREENYDLCGLLW